MAGPPHAAQPCLAQRPELVMCVEIWPDGPSVRGQIGLTYWVEGGGERVRVERRERERVGDNARLLNQAEVSLRTAAL